MAGAKVKSVFKSPCGVASGENDEDVVDLQELVRRVNLFTALNAIQHEVRAVLDYTEIMDHMGNDGTHEGGTESRTYTSLNSLYLPIFREFFCEGRAEDDDVVRSVLNTVALAAEPLSPSAIATLTDIPYDQVQRVLQSVQPLLEYSEGPDRPVQFFHKSLSDFIAEMGFHTSPDYQTKLVLSCLKLMNRALRRDMFSIPEYVLNSEVEDLQKRIEESGVRGALEYACKSWYKHLTATTDRPADVISALHHFLELKFPFWLEVLSAIDAVDDAIRALEAIVRWLDEIHASTDAGVLLDITTDFLCFVTEFFEVISRSVPYIYQSALLFAPRSSLVRKLYEWYISPIEPRVMTDIPASWNSSTASARATSEVTHAVWSSHGQLVAVGWADRVELRDSNSLRSVSILKPPGGPHVMVAPQSLAFSPDGRLLACAYHRIRQGWKQSIPTPGTLRIWDVQTNSIVNDIRIDNFCEIAFSGFPRTITLAMGGNLRTYDASTGTQLCGGELLSSCSQQLGASWVHGGSLRFPKSFVAEGQPTIAIYELRPTSNIQFPVIESFVVPLHDGKFSFSPISYHASFVTETEAVILDVRASKTLFRANSSSPPFIPPGRFSSDGCFFACGKTDEICVWENTSTGYTFWGIFRPKLPFTGFALSPAVTSILSWGPKGIELLHPEKFTDGSDFTTSQQDDIVVSRRAIVDPVESLLPAMYPRTQGAGYQHGDQRACFPGTQEDSLRAIKSWITSLVSPPGFLVIGLAGTGKTAISQTVAEWCDVNGLPVSSYFCSPGADKDGDLRLIFPILATQLAQKHPEIRSALVPFLQSNEEVVYESASNQMEKLIINPLKLADVPAVIIIDGLDEWIDHTSQSTILSILSDRIKGMLKVKLLITSRPKTHILDDFLFLELFGPALLYPLFETAPDVINNDIRLFLEHELSGLASRNGLDNWPTTVELDLLCSRANGLFVYAVATVKFLDQRQVSPIKQYATIAKSPQDTIHEGTVEEVHRGLSLDSLCLLVIQEACRGNDAEYNAVVRSVLAMVVLVVRPLPSPTVAALLRLEVEEATNILRAIQSLLIFDGDSDQPVRPFHRLVADLLTSPTRCADKRFCIPPGKFHPEIALNCLRLMNGTLDDSFSLKNRTEGSEVGDLPGETALEYACTAWHIHLAETREDVAALVPTLRHFLEEKSAVWLKVLSTKVDTAPALNTITRWLREVAKDDQLLATAELLVIKGQALSDQQNGLLNPMHAHLVPPLCIM